MKILTFVSLVLVAVSARLV